MTVAKLWIIFLSLLIRSKVVQDPQKIAGKQAEAALILRGEKNQFNLYDWSPCLFVSFSKFLSWFFTCWEICDLFEGSGKDPDTSGAETLIKWFFRFFSFSTLFRFSFLFFISFLPNLKDMRSFWGKLKRTRYFRCWYCDIDKLRVPKSSNWSNLGNSVITFRTKIVRKKRK